MSGAHYAVTRTPCPVCGQRAQTNHEGELLCWECWEWSATIRVGWRTAFLVASPTGFLRASA